MYKLIRDGKVAVLTTMGYGAGWSTWHPEFPEILFDPIVVDAVEREIELDAMECYLSDTYGEEDWYFSGYDNLVITWIPVGTEFVVKEYDGAESIQYKANINWLVA